MTINEQVVSFFKANRIDLVHKKVLLSVSGGIDSMVLLDVFLQHAVQWNCSIGVFHLNHEIRGKEAVRDYEFVKRVSDLNGLPFHGKCINIPAEAAQRKIGIEVCAREVRYQEAAKIKEQYHYDYVVTAHHQSDFVESVLMHIIRGCGINGLVGIRPVLEEYVLRPLLSVSKQDILDYAENNQIKYVTDSTNNSQQYERNKLRLSIIPTIEEINPQFQEKLFQLSQRAVDNLQMINQFVDDSCIKRYSDHSLYMDCELLLQQDVIVQQELICRFLELSGLWQDITSQHILQISALITCPDKTTWQFDLPKGKKIMRQYNRIIILTDDMLNTEDYCYPVKKFGQFVFAKECFSVKIEKGTYEEFLLKKPGVEFIDGDLLQGALIVRNRKAGDRFYPLGLSGTKKVKNYFIDKKIPHNIRNTIPLLICKDEITVILGHTIDRRFKINENTKQIIKITYETW